MSKKRRKKKKQKIQPQKHPHSHEIQGFLLLSFALALLLSLMSFAYAKSSFNWLGLIGYVIGWSFHTLFGLGSYFLCLFLGWAGWRLFLKKPINRLAHKLFFATLFILSFCVLVTLLENRYPSTGKAIGQLFYTAAWEKDLSYRIGGAPFYYLYYDLPKYNFFRILNTAGIALIFSTSLIVSILFLTKVSLVKLLSQLLLLMHKIKHAAIFLYKKTLKLLESAFEKMPKFAFAHEEVSGFEEIVNIEEVEPMPEEAPPLPIKEKVKTSLLEKRQEALRAQSVYNGDFKKFLLPGASLLTSPKKIDQTLLKKGLKENAEILEETLKSFGIEAQVGDVNCGPTITSFEVHPAIGVKVQKVKALQNDIALNMKATSIRILAPIPGKAAIGIEVPNSLPQEVSFKELVQAYQRSSRKFRIPLLLGKAVNGEYVMSDLAKMPHCIIAGATGSGKSVCINTLIMSILYNAKPDEIKLILVDPKKVELTPYSRLPHMLAPVITEPEGACKALKWLVKEMETRYELLKLIGQRNIEGYNSRKIDKELEESLEKEFPKNMHYIVCIIDELADLMMVASNDIETPIARIAQMARAVGIHLVLATQRPSREVITGIIKANFPTRIAFKVASRINSQIILDEMGAESLLGNGDLLFSPPGSSNLVRAQGAYIRDQDLNRVIRMLRSQAPPNYVIESFDNLEDQFLPELDDLDEGSDSLYLQAKEIVMSTGNASTTFLQRKLKIGYARAASIMDELESQGVVSHQEGSRARKVLLGNKASPD